MNGATHVEYARTARSLIVRHGFAPSVRHLLEYGLTETEVEFANAAALPDAVHEVTVMLPGSDEPRTELLGHNLSSFEHFQRDDGSGYYWPGDVSLSVAGPVAQAIAAAARAQVVLGTSGTQAPLTPLVEPPPVQRCVGEQAGVTICSCEFPSAALGASYYGDAARLWARDGNADGWRRCAGYALHFVQDSLVPHHAWGVLLCGHATWEDDLQDRWHRVLVDTVEAGLMPTLLARAVRRDLTELRRASSLDDLCHANAEWTRARFGAAHDLPECPGDVALAVSVRAVAASIRACELIGGGS